MGALQRKLLRELWGMRGQVLAIALVLASGVATLVGSASTLDSLEQTQRAFYAEYRFAEVFADLKRAPAHLADRLRRLPGIAQAETRVVAGATLDAWWPAPLWICPPSTSRSPPGWSPCPTAANHASTACFCARAVCPARKAATRP